MPIGLLDLIRKDARKCGRPPRGAGDRASWRASEGAVKLHNPGPGGGGAGPAEGAGDGFGPKKGGFDPEKGRFSPLLGCIVCS